MDETYRYFHSYVTLTLVNGDQVKRAIYSYQSDSVSDQDTLDGVPQIVGDLLNDKGFEELFLAAPIERVEVNGKWIITEQEFYDAPDRQRLP